MSPSSERIPAVAAGPEPGDDRDSDTPATPTPELASSPGRWVDDRLRVSKFADSVLNHVFPDNWSFLLGEIAMYCFVILVLTGVYLTFFFHPGSRDVVYEGSYAPLRGVHMSEAYESTISLSFDVRAGLVVRQIHHWTADIFAAAIVVHLCRIFFTGAFRRPREINWIIGVTMLILVIFNGFAGYSLPDDLLSATGLRIGYSILLSIPLVGTWLASLFFGGTYPGPAVVDRLFIIHVLILPALIAVLLSAHLAIVWRQKHTQFPGAGRTEHNVVGLRLWPTYAAKSAGLFAGVFAVGAALGGLAQINPLWLYGPYRTGAVTTAAQPDWYMGWLEGALRLFPAWRVHLFGHTIPEVFWPGVVVPTLTFALLYAWPFLEARVTGDQARSRVARPTARAARAHRDRHRRADVLHRAVRGRFAGHLRPTPRLVDRDGKPDVPRVARRGTARRGDYRVEVVPRPVAPGCRGRRTPRGRRRRR